jgi:hypothetical protein
MISTALVSFDIIGYGKKVRARKENYLIFYSNLKKKQVKNSELPEFNSPWQAETR